uniref:Transcriptional regulator n=1 Tax=Haemonchus contortus TaxID=6289 RepID=A0A7I4YXP2_HAECO
MGGVELSLKVKNKYIFTQNRAKIRREIVEAVEGKEDILAMESLECMHFIYMDE